MSETRPEKRIAILGTAPTWRECPFGDPSLEVWALNDMHVLNPPRASRWFDLHPVEKMYFRKPDRKVIASEVPAGYFVRPTGHLEWLRKQTIPVYVQDAKALGSPSARTFPKAEIEQKIGPYFASSPAWMIGLALLEGVTELHIYGIHLATEWEYVKQKPNLQFLLGLAVGKGVHVIVPKGAPLIVESHQYAYEEDPDTPKVALQRRMEQLLQERAMVAKSVPTQWWKRTSVNTVSRLAWLDAQIADVKLGIQHHQAGRAPAGA
jgi:hypothetical protein